MQYKNNPQLAGWLRDGGFPSLATGSLFEVDHVEFHRHVIELRKQAPTESTEHIRDRAAFRCMTLGKPPEDRVPRVDPSIQIQALTGVPRDYWLIPKKHQKWIIAWAVVVLFLLIWSIAAHAQIANGGYLYTRNQFLVGSTWTNASSGNPFPITCVSGCVAGGSFTDNSAFTVSGSSISPVGGYYTSGADPACTSGNACRFRVDSHSWLGVNCQIGCSGGASTPADGFANPTTASLAMSFGMIWNGSTWDRMQGDASKFLKVNCAAGCSGGSSTPTDAFANPTTAILSQDFLMGWNGVTWDRLKSTTANGLVVDVSRVQGNVTAIQGTPASLKTQIYGFDGGATQAVSTSGSGVLSIAQSLGALGDALSNTSQIGTGGAQAPLAVDNYGYNGSTWDRLRATTANGLAVDVTRITGTVGVTQSTSPWVVSVPTWAGGTLGAMANYGTSPGAVLVPGVNAFITNTPAVTLTSTTITGTVAVTQSTSPWVIDVSKWANTTLGVPTNFGTTPGAVIAGSVNASLFSGTTALGTPNTFGATAPTGNALGVNSALFVATTLAINDGTAGALGVGGHFADNGVAAATNRIPTLDCIYQTSYLNGTAATQGRNGAQSCGTDGLLWTANLPAMRPASYHASASIAGSSTTAMSVLPGNASDTVLVTGIHFTCTQTTAGFVTVTVNKTSAAATGGTSAGMTEVPDDSGYAAASTAALTYTGTGPTVGTLVGQIDAQKIGCNAAATASPNDIYYLNLRQKPIVLRGTAQTLEIGTGGAVTGGNITVTWDWIETATITP